MTLTDQERDDLQKYLSHPLDFPQEFKSWVSDWVATNIPKIHVSQILGFKLLSVKSAPFTPTIYNTTSTSFQNFGGPTISGVSNGFYIALFGFGVTFFRDRSVEMGLSVDGGTIDPDKVASVNAGYNGRVALFDLTQGSDNHTFAAQFRVVNPQVATSYDINNPWLHVMKVAFDE